VAALIALAAVGAALFAAPCHAAENTGDAFPHGLSYMTAFGPKNYSVVSLLYGVIVISLVVMTIIGVLVLAGALIRGRRGDAATLRSVPIERGGFGLLFIYIGIGLSFLVLTATVVWNYSVLADIVAPSSRPVATVHIVGHQWWWEVDYEGADPSRNFVTANEIHVPVGEPVKVTLSTADVIHSFWVPALTGKMDTIPGQHNTTWMQADKPGIYRGQCTEYCGQQHAHMAFVVMAQAPNEFKTWWDHQLQGPKELRAESGLKSAEAGQMVFMKNCAVCHTVRGTMAHGKVGPDLSHLMERHTIAAGTLPNSIGALSGWISNPQHIKPGNFMPTLDLSAEDLNNLRSFLETLQ
jgi:cytochrome c oxidase subunit 2